MAGLNRTLTTSTDWTEWYFKITWTAKCLDVWDLCNPDAATPPVTLTKPTPPKVGDIESEVTEAEDLDDDEYTKFERRWDEYEDGKRAYEREHEKLGQINDLIFQSVARKNHIWIIDNDSVYEKLKALKKHLAPSERVEKLTVRLKYIRLSNIKIEDIDAWLAEWTTMLLEAEILKLPEMQDGLLAFLFISAITSISPQFANIERYRFGSLISGDKPLPDCMDLVILYTQDRQMHDAKNAYDACETMNQPAAAATLSGKNDGRDKGKKKCVCGLPHKMEKCYYLHESLRPAEWKSKEGTRKNIIKKLDGDKVLAQRIKTLQETVKGKTKKMEPRLGGKDGTIAEKKNDQEPEIFTTQFWLRTQSSPSAQSSNNTSFSQLNRNESSVTSALLISTETREAYAIRQNDADILATSWILDAVTKVHICNSTKGFAKTRDSLPGESVQTETGHHKIEAWGAATLKLNGDNGPITIDLLNIAYTPEFYTNCVSEHRLELKDVYYDGENSRLRHKDRTFAKMTEHDGLRFLVRDQPTVSFHCTGFVSYVNFSGLSMGTCSDP